MTGTPYTDIYDLFLNRIKDWRLNVLYNNGDGEADLNTYLQGFLILAIPDFDNCTQDLEDRDDTTLNQFNQTLTTQNKVILSLLMTKKWLDKEIRDVTQMSLHLQGGDFRTFSEQSNLKAKQEYAIILDEEISQTLTKYGYSNLNWQEWFAGNFMG
jgi:hypothetical protein